MGFAGAAHAASGARRRCRYVDLVLGALPEDVGQPVQFDAGAPAIRSVGAGEEELPEDGLGAPRGVADHRVVDGDVAPAEHLEPLLGGELLDLRRHRPGLARIARQEGDAGGVGAGIGQVEVHDLPVEAVRHLDQDAGPVAGVLLGTEGAPVLELAEGADPECDDVVAALAPEVTDEVDAAGVVLEPRVIEALGAGQAGSGWRLRREGGGHEGNGAGAFAWGGYWVPPVSSSNGAGPGRGPG